MLKRATQHRVAVVQHPPVTLHREKTLQRGVDLIEEAAAGGAALVSLPETWLPGYPEWLWRRRPGGDSGPAAGAPARPIEDAVDLGAGHLQPVPRAAKRPHVREPAGIPHTHADVSSGSPP